MAGKITLSGEVINMPSCCTHGVAIPQPKSNEQSNRVEIYEKNVELLAPEVCSFSCISRYNSEFMSFCRQFCDSMLFSVSRGRRSKLYEPVKKPLDKLKNTKIILDSHTSQDPPNLNENRTREIRTNRSNRRETNDET